MEENKSPHSSPAFMVNNHSEQKRGKPRMVINYKRLNELTVFDGYFLPNKELLVNKTLTKKWFSKFDCKSGFYQIKLTDAAKPLTAFSTPQGQYIWNVMPMGLKNAPQIFQRRMDNIFSEYSDFCLVYVDDILIFSDNLADHANHLMKFIQKNQDHGLILSSKKAEIAKPQIEFLGLKIDHTGIEMQPHICEKIANFPDHLVDRKQVERFLGCINYVNDFLPNLAWLKGPLQDLLKKRMNQQWQDYHTGIVRQLKQMCQKLPRLAIPDTGDKLIVETDASDKYWGGVLKAQKGDKEYICRYANGSFKPAEVNYHSNEKELLALKRSFSKFHFFILPVRFLVRTDNTNVKAYIFNKLPSTPEYKRRHRWQQYFQEYQFDIEHIKGKNNHLADFLSREANDSLRGELFSELQSKDIARDGNSRIDSSPESADRTTKSSARGDTASSTRSIIQFG